MMKGEGFPIPRLPLTGRSGSSADGSGIRHRSPRFCLLLASKRQSTGYQTISAFQLWGFSFTLDSEVFLERPS